MVLIEGTLVGFASSPKELAELLAKRRYQLGVASRAMDDIAGLADGHVSKLECGTKTLGGMSLPLLLEAMGCRLALIADDATIPAKTKAFLHTAGSASYPHGPAATATPVPQHERDLPKAA